MKIREIVKEKRKVEKLKAYSKEVKTKLEEELERAIETNRIMAERLWTPVEEQRKLKASKTASWFMKELEKL